MKIFNYHTSPGSTETNPKLTVSDNLNQTEAEKYGWIEKEDKDWTFHEGHAGGKICFAENLPDLQNQIEAHFMQANGYGKTDLYFRMDRPFDKWLIRNQEEDLGTVHKGDDNLYRFQPYGPQFRQGEGRDNLKGLLFYVETCLWNPEAAIEEFIEAEKRLKLVQAELLIAKANLARTEKRFKGVLYGFVWDDDFKDGPDAFPNDQKTHVVQIGGYHVAFSYDGEEMEIVEPEIIPIVVADSYGLTK